MYQSAKEITELKKVFEQMMTGVQEYSIILLDTKGNILTWNKGVEKIKGYKADEIIGQHISIFYLPEDRNLKLAEKLMEEAKTKGNAFHIGKRLRKNGSIFWGRIELTAIKNEEGTIIGYTKMANPLSSTTELGNFWFDNDGILHVVASHEPFTEDKVEEFRAILKAALHGQAICCVADIRNAEIPGGAGSFSQPLVSLVYKAVAFISESPADPNTELGLKLLPKGVPAKVVRNREEGSAWVRNFM